MRGNLDGSSFETLVTLPFHQLALEIALDREGGKMYWTTIWRASAPGMIQRANLDGSNVEELAIEGLVAPVGIALDLRTGCQTEEGDVDIDDDGQPDFCDPCPTDPNNDLDGDGVCSVDDVCPGLDDTLDEDDNGIPDCLEMIPTVSEWGLVILTLLLLTAWKIRFGVCAVGGNRYRQPFTTNLG